MGKTLPRENSDLAAVRVEEEAFADRRYNRLARLAGLADADHARGKLLVLWRQCTIENREDLPHEDVLDVLGENGVDALVESGLGEHSEGGRVRIKGTKGRIEWLSKLKENGKYGKLGGRPKGSKNKTHEGSQNNPEGSENKTPITTTPSITITTTTAPITTKAKAREIYCSPAGRTEVTKAEIESVYASYPKKVGKAQGIAKAVKVIRTREEFDRFKTCVEAMAQGWSGRDTQFCPGFAPFIQGKRWQDEHWPMPPTNTTQKGGGLSAAEIWQMAQDMRGNENE